MYWTLELTGGKFAHMVTESASGWRNLCGLSIWKLLKCIYYESIVDDASTVVERLTAETVTMFGIRRSWCHDPGTQFSLKYGDPRTQFSWKYGDPGSLLSREHGDPFVKIGTLTWPTLNRTVRIVINIYSRVIKRFEINYKDQYYIVIRIMCHGK